jgi:hypothetical protein
MARHMLVALTNTAEGHDEEYQEWYANVHTPDLLAVPGFLSVHRFALAPDQGFLDGEGKHRYITLYEIETDDVAGTLAGLEVAAQDMIIPPLARDAVRSVYTPLADRAVAADVPPPAP